MDPQNTSMQLLLEERAKREELTLRVAAHVAKAKVRDEWLHAVRVLSEELRARMKVCEERGARIEAYLHRLDARMAALTATSEKRGLS